MSHTSYEPTTEEFCCPKCNAKSGTWHILNAANCKENGEDCELLHKSDSLACFDCGHTTTGATFVKNLLKKKNLVECPCCKGKGVVPKEAT